MAVAGVVLAALGLPIHGHAFDPATVTPGVVASAHRAPHLPEGAAGTGPTVSFARSGLNVRWSAAFNSLL